MRHATLLPSSILRQDFSNRTEETKLYELLRRNSRHWLVDSEQDFPHSNKKCLSSKTTLMDNGRKDRFEFSKTSPATPHRNKTSINCRRYSAETLGSQWESTLDRRYPTIRQ